MEPSNSADGLTTPGNRSVASKPSTPLAATMTVAGTLAAGFKTSLELSKMRAYWPLMNVPRTSVENTVVTPLLMRVLRMVDRSPVRDGKLVLSSAKSKINWLTPLLPIFRAELSAGSVVGWMASVAEGIMVSDAETMLVTVSKLLVTMAVSASKLVSK